MNRGRWISGCSLTCVLALTLVACGGGEGGGSAREGEFATIREQRDALYAKRDEVRALKEQITAAGEMAEPAEDAAEAEGAEGEEMENEAEVPAEDLEAQLAEMSAEVDDLSDNYISALVKFLNSANMLADEAPTGMQLEAIRLKSSEDMLIAQEYIDRGGNYLRAIEILNTSLEIDPENPDLLAAREQAKSDQFMTIERFEAVIKGMTLADVQSRLGTPLPRNVREYPEKKRLSWYYLREDKGAAGVFFEEKDGVMTVYLADFDFIKASEESP